MFIALPTPLYYAYACVSLRFAYVCCFDNHTSLLILSLFSSIMCSSLCYRIADIAFSVCRTCVLYIFLLCFVSSPRIVVVGVHFCCLKNFFFYCWRNQNEFTSSFPARGPFHIHSSRSRELFLHNEEDFSLPPCFVFFFFAHPPSSQFTEFAASFHRIPSQ